MSKLETVRALNASAPQSGVVESVRELQQKLALMEQTLQELPDAIAASVVNGTGQALKPLGALSADAQKAVAAFDSIATQQRRSLDALAEQMTNSAAAAFEKKAGTLNAGLVELRNLKQIAAQIGAIPEELNEASRYLRTSAELLMNWSQRPRWWKTALMMISSIAIGGTLAATGQAALTQYLPPSQIRKDAEFGRIVWNRATLKERKLIEEILKRPE